MVQVTYSENFKKRLSKIKDKEMIERIQKLLIKITQDPETGKPMKYARKGTREVYVGSFRLSYAFEKNQNNLILLDLYHKDEQ
jgi:mRNA-degrading endonuclease RelE of RelBE toxin-antitoxin system